MLKWHALRLTSYKLLISYLNQMQLHLAVVLAETHEFRLNKQHLRTNLGHSEQFRDVLIEQTDAAI